MNLPPEAQEAYAKLRAHEEAEQAEAERAERELKGPGNRAARRRREALLRRKGVSV